MRSYVDDIMQFPRLTPDDEIELAALIAQGSEPALDHLINCNLRLVIKIAHDFKNRGVPLADLVQCGNLGLMKAAKKFDPAKGAKFSTYAAWWIKQNIRGALSQDKTIRIPVSSANRIRRIRAIQNKLGPDATVAQIVKESDLPETTVRNLIYAGNTTVSLNTTFFDDCDEDRITALPDQEQSVGDLLLLKEDKEFIMQLITHLETREQHIIIRRYGFVDNHCYTLQEISDSLSITRERVRQIQNIALAKLLKLYEKYG